MEGEVDDCALAVNRAGRRLTSLATMSRALSALVSSHSRHLSIASRSPLPTLM